MAPFPGAETLVGKHPSRARSTTAALAPRVTAIVVVHRVDASASGQAPLDLCLRSALAEPWIDELVIVDQDNPAAVSSMLRAFEADRRDVRVLKADADVGAAAATNLGASQARGRWLLFLGPDVVLQRGAVARMAAAGGGADGPWIVGGKLIDLEGRERAGVRGGTLNAFSAIAVAVGWRAKPKKQRGPQQIQAAQVGAVSGALMLLPRSSFERLNGFDERFVGSCADLDLCRRAAAEGGSVLFQPRASGVQFEHGRTAKRRAQALALFAMKSARTPAERVFARMAGPALTVLVAFKDFVAGRPPRR
jgi:GT2 family glycosyltransferase